MGRLLFDHIFRFLYIISKMKTLVRDKRWT